jgi:Skp family chaperone for outer membrane proteins
MDRTEKDNTQKARLIFLSLAALVAILLIWSLVAANKARLDRDVALMEVDRYKQDNIKLEQLIKDLNQENEGLKKKIQQLQTKPKAKPAVKKKAAKPAKTTTNKKTTKTKTQ